MQAAKFREMTEQELHNKLQDYRKELFNLRFQHATGQLENTQRPSKVKKNIARILTILRERQTES